MSSGSWTNSDGLYLQFGTTKAVPEVGGDYVMYGPNRIAEVTFNLSSLTTSASTIVSNTLFFPGGLNNFIEKVEVITEVASTTNTALSIGLVQDDRTSSVSGSTAFVNGISTGMTTAGNIASLSVGSTYVGGLVGSYNTSYNTNTSGSNSAGGYISAILGTSTATGTIRCRIYYHGVGTISN